MTKGFLWPAFLGLLALSALAQENPLEKRTEKLIQSLSDDSREARDLAVAELVKIGKPALEALKKAAAGKDTDVKSLATQAIERIEWGQGIDKLKEYVKEHFEEGATVEPLKEKSIARWCPEAKFFEVAGGAPAAGPAAVMGIQSPKSIFAVQKYEAQFYRIMVKGIFATVPLVNLIRKQNIRLDDYDKALDFALSIKDLAGSSALQGAASWAFGGGGGRFEKTDEGWNLQQTMGTSFLLKTDKSGMLIDVVPSSNPLGMYGQLAGLGGRGSEEKEKLEVEKLKMEIELLKRQIDAKK